MGFPVKTPSKVAIVSILAGAGFRIVDAWDWLGRASGLDSWLTTNRTTFPGEIVTQLEHNAWALIVIGLLFWWHDSARPKDAPPRQITVNALPTIVPQELLDQANREAEIAGIRDRSEAISQERDSLRKKVAELEAKITFPDFIATILDVQESEHGTSPNAVFAVLAVALTNNGAKSVARNFKVNALSVSGFRLSIDVLVMSAFTLKLNDGKDCIDYAPEHYLMNRTHSTPVERGVPVTGILPCNFNGISSLKEVDFRSLKVSLTDGIGDANELVKNWQSEPLTDINYNEVVPHTSRPGLPGMRRCE